MAKKASSGGKSLVIVESPAKARTISKFLGGGYQVEASIGHVRDLPKGKKEVPKKFKDAEWANLGVNVDQGFAPIYIVPAEKKQQVDKLKKLVQESVELYLATDEDREGEAISWHLFDLLKPTVPVKRLVFHEITKAAIEEALANPREIDNGLVRAQETRRILDRLYGYEVSPLLWRKIRRGLSAGRVQSVAVRLIVDRERERRAFVSARYFGLLGEFATAKGEQFQATMTAVDGKRAPAGRDFDPNTGKPKNPDDLALLDEAGAQQLADRLRKGPFQVVALEQKPYTTRPSAPFTTSTMQQEANRKLSFTARHTMRVAQSLYENGYITYMRTDSTTLASEAVSAARDLVTSEYGAEFLPDQPRVYASKVKNAQEAHEAIRPAGHPFRLPESLKAELNRDQFRLFELIWKRTIASQMQDARGQYITITIQCEGVEFQVRGKTIEFPGFLRAYVEGSDDPTAELADRETLLPNVVQDELLDCLNLDPTSHETKPPARYSEASLTRKLEEMGIGRPSTYASIIDTILERDYVFKKGSALVPTWTAFSVSRLMERHLPKLVDYQFTAEMEDYLDSISRGEAEHLRYLRRFYFGDDPADVGLKHKLEAKLEEIDARKMSQFAIGEPDEGAPVFLRVGRYGPFLEQGESESPDYRKASIPHDLPPDELTLSAALQLLEQAAMVEEPLGEDPATGRPIYVKQGRFGPYIQLGTPDDEEKPRNASIKGTGVEVQDVDLETALKILELPKTLGDHPESKEPVVAHNGRFGPYVKCGAETRSLPGEVGLLAVTLEQALALLAQPKARGRGRAAPKEPLKTFEASPVTEEPIKLLDGRYGPYVTDGETNASLPKSMAVEDLTFEMALQLLAERAAAGGGKKKKKKSAKKKTAKKKKASKKSAKKKTSKKTAKAKKASKKAAKAKASNPSDAAQVADDA